MPGCSAIPTTRFLYKPFGDNQQLDHELAATRIAKQDNTITVKRQFPVNATNICFDKYEQACLICVGYIQARTCG